MDVRNWKKHLFRTTSAQEPHQSGCNRFQHHGLADDQENGDDGVSANVLYLQLHQPLPEEMQDGKEINDHKQAIDDQFRDESLQRLTNLLFAWSGHVTSRSS